MKIKLLLIVMALLASYPAAFAEGDDIGFFDEPAEVETIGDIALDDTVDAELEETDPLLLYELAQLNGENVAWDGVTTAEPDVVDGVYEIRNGAELAWIAEQVNSQKDSLGKYSGMNGVSIRLAADIDLGGQDWTPIGYSYDRPFAGEFDGDGHSVSGLSFDASGFTNCGLFGCVLGTVKNLNVSTKEGGISTFRHVTPSYGDPTKYGIGIIAGSVDCREWDYDKKEHSGAIENCTASGAIEVTNAYDESVYVGGVVGVNSGASLADNTNKAAVSFKSTAKNGAERAFVGGIAGCNYGELVNNDEFVYAEAPDAAVSAESANPFVGAVAGGNAGVIVNAAYNGEALGIGKRWSAYDVYASLGGVAGLNGGTIEGCLFAGELVPNVISAAEDTAFAVGGIAGSMTDLFETTGVIDECKAEGKVSIETDADINAGLIAGSLLDAESAITDCSSSGEGVVLTGISNTVNAGGIVGEVIGVIDSCESNAGVSVEGSAPINAGGIAGAALGTVTDCISRSNITVSCDLADAPAYAGGITGTTQGSIIRSAYRGGTISDTAVRSFAGGIAGSVISILSEGAEPAEISKCVFGSDAAINCADISGGIVGEARAVTISQCASEGTLSGTEGASVGAGGVVGTATSKLVIRNCKVSAKLETETAAGAVFAVTGTNNSITTSYLAPEFNNKLTYAVAHSENADEITTYGVYFNKDVSGVDVQREGVAAVSAAEAADRTTFTQKSDEKLNFDTIWLMGESGPELQFESYSNSHAVLTEATENRLYFHVTMENPDKGGKAYIALYNSEGRFCGTVSAQPEETDTNRTGTKAEMALEYGYNYWYNPKNYDENGDPKPADEWIPSEFVPAKMKAFTWNDTKGMKNLSSVEEQDVQIYFE